MKSPANKVILRLKLLAFLFVLHLGIFSGRSENEITSSGILTSTMFNGNRTVPEESSINQFSATVSMDGKWTIEVQPIHKSGDTLYGKTDIIYLTFDGIDTYFCQYTEAVIGLTNGRPGIVGIEAIANRPQLAYVSAGNYPFAPFDDQKRAQILWMIYGMGQYVHNSKPETIPLPWIPARWMMLSYGFQPQYDLAADPPYVPIGLKFVRDSKLDLLSEDNEYKRPELDQPGDKQLLLRWQDELQKRKTKWKDGAIAGQIVIGGLTNLDGFSVPLSFKFQTFLWSGRVRQVYEATITNIAVRTPEEISALEFRPPVLSTVGVIDSRFRVRDKSRELDSIQYNIEANALWPSKNSEFAQKKFNIFLGAPALSKIHKFSVLSDQVKRFIIIGILAATAIIPLIFGWFSWRHRTQTINKP